MATIITPSDNITIKFWKHVRKTNSCWIWIAGQDGYGYGSLWDGKKQVKAHRYSWEIHKGKIPDGISVLHHCDNPPCVNPEHLFLGTTLDNIIDMDNKGRRKHAGRGRCSKVQVLEIRKLYKTGLYRPDELSRLYKIGKRSVHNIVLERTWKWLL